MQTSYSAENASFSRNLLRLAVPIVLQNLVTTAVSSADVIMLGFVSQDALAAGSLASQIMFILNLVYSGISSGVIMLAAQYWGKQDTLTIERIMGIGMRISILISTVFFILAFFFPALLMRIFTNDMQLVSTGIPYLKIVSFSYLFMSISQVYLCTMRTIERVIFATAANASALLLNILLNAVFIFGLLGAPKMGIAGVALATTIARGIEFVICMLDALKFKTIRFRPSTIFERHKLLFADFMKYSLPAFGNEVSWGLAFSMYSVIMGHLGSDIVAANAVVVVARNLGTVSCFGIANAGAILLGKSIGAGRMETVKADASKFCKITFISGMIGGIFIFLLRPLFMNMADLTATAQGYLNIMLFINMYYVLGQAMNTAVICGVFRSGGDSKWGFICDTIDMWGYAVPMGFFTAFVLKLPPMWVYFIICTDEFVKIPFVYKHYKSYKWLKNITREF
ncbi:MAG: MATE family efflux transporter [Firmicutes bacterium]|nr:MATE family efflux transporter [Bacillota bacterium]